MLRAAALVLALLASGSVACASDEDDELRRSFAPIHERLARLGSSVRDALQHAETKTNGQLARQFAGFADDLAALDRDLRGLDTPASVGAEARALHAAMSRVRTSLAGIATASREGSVRAGRSATRRLARDGDRLDRALTRLLGRLD